MGLGGYIEAQTTSMLLVFFGGFVFIDMGGPELWVFQLNVVTFFQMKHSINI